MGTNLGLPDMPACKSGVNFLKTWSNMFGLKGFPLSRAGISLIFELKSFGMSKLEMNSTNACNVG